MISKRLGASSLQSLNRTLLVVEKDSCPIEGYIISRNGSFMLVGRSELHIGGFPGTRSVRTAPNFPASSSSQSRLSGARLSNSQRRFLGNLSSCFKRIIFNDCLQLVVVNFRRAASTLLIFDAHNASESFANNTLGGFGDASLARNYLYSVFPLQTSPIWTRRRRHDGNIVLT